MVSRRRLPTVSDQSDPSLPASVTTAVGFLVNEVALVFRMSFEQVLAAHRVRPRQYFMLLVLRDEGPMPQHALGQRLGIDRTTTMQLVQALADAGIVDRRDDPADRRVYRLSLSADGRRLTATLEGQIKRAEHLLLAPLPIEERSAFAAQLRAILAWRGIDGCTDASI